MGERFTKFKSNYLMRSRHQGTDLGTIMERDWVTTNGLNVLRFGAGRRIWYNSGNFVFTTSNVPTYHKKHKLTTETNEWNWEDCKDADGTVNDVKPNIYTNDIRNFAYYGSCVELIRATIEEIISDFPGRLIVSDNQLEGYGIEGYILKNDFNIDLHHKTVTLGKYDNELRFMSNSWNKYCIKTEYGFEDIVNFTIGDWLGDLSCPKNDEGQNVVNMTFKTINNSYVVKGYSINRKIVYVYNSNSLFVIQPKQEYIDEYFFNLKGFKAQLLRQDTKPLYSNKFKTPIEYNFKWYYPEKYYVWPSDDYCIDVDSITFTNYTRKLIDMGQKFDELWSDNIYRSMTHEAIKNFDWTYSRDYYEGEEQDNIDGGERMAKILRVFGRVFDDVKCYIDSIKNMTNITYDKIRNCPEALMSDNVEMKGVDTVTTIGKDYDINTSIDKEYLTNNVTKDISWIDMPRTSTHKKWFQKRNSEDIYPDICDNELMRRFSISYKRLMQTKGTQHSIDMLMGFFGFGRDPFTPNDTDDYTITEEAFYTKKLLPYNECVNGKEEVHYSKDDEIDIATYGKLKEENKTKCTEKTEGETVYYVVNEDFDDEREVGDDWTDNEDLPVTWSNIQSNIKGDLIAEINSSKDADLLYYNDPYSGIPLRTILVGSDNKPFIVPYYDPYVVYDGNLMFQGKGGWGKFVNPNDTDPTDDCFDYQETLSYLHVVGCVGDLLTVNANTVKKGDIYYVASLEDYTKYDEEPPYVEDKLTVSHYFVLIDEYNPNKLYAWKNIVAKPSNVEEGMVKVDKTAFEEFFGTGADADWFYDAGSLTDPTEEQKKSVYEYCFRHMEYLENIFSTNIGNNPHVGYGNYDDGIEFLEYMQHPFKYSIDKKLFNDLSYENIAQMVSFDDILKKQSIVEVEFDTYKIGDILDEETYNELSDEYKAKCSELDYANRVTDKIQILGKTKDEDNLLVSHYNEKSDANDASNLWYINTKVLTITNNIKTTYTKSDGSVISYEEWKVLSLTDKQSCVKNDLMFRNYFKGVILPYLIQVIPSTTILKLKGF